MTIGAPDTLFAQPVLGTATFHGLWNCQVGICGIAIEALVVVGIQWRKVV
jgi:hypothetical protein